MKKLLLSVICCFLAASVFAQAIMHTPQLSPFTRKYLHDIKNERQYSSSEYALRKLADGKTYLRAMIKVADAPLALAGMESLGALVGTKAGNIWTVHIPADQAEAFCNLNGILYIELDQPVYPKLNVARQTTHADSVHNGINLPQAYTGKNVVMGVLDFGFDYNHPTFYDTTHSQYRIKKVWELNSIGTPPAGYAYGNEITDTTLIKAQGTDNALQMHGTSTAGIAAGSGFGSTPQTNRFRGFAYESDLVLVGVRRDTIAQQWMQGSFSDFVDGINYVFDYSTSVSKPAVVNISWGSQSGPHDGSTLFNQACNNLSGPGKIVVMSAGNEGQEKIHLSKTFTPTDTVLNTFLNFTSNVYKRTWVDTWGEAGKTFCASVTLYHNGVAGTSTGYYCIDDSIHDVNLIASNGIDTCVVQFITSASTFNGKPRTTVDIYNKSADSVAVSIKSNDGTIHAWNEYYYYGYVYGYQCSFDSLNQNWAVSGNNVSTVSDMGAADSVIMVGAYCSKSNFTDINGNSWTYNGYVLPARIVPFSSRGPMADGRIKPDITAPGLTIATSSSSYDTSYTPTGSNSALVIKSYFDATLNKTFYYSEFSGTSASAPCVAGIVAMMMEVNPNLSAKQALDIIAATAITDIYTTALPPQGNNTWGHGKINAYQAIKTLLIQTGNYTYTGEMSECLLYPNPAKNYATLSYEAKGYEDLIIELVDIKGSIIQCSNWNVKDGMNEHKINLENLSSGSYVVKVTSAKGSANMMLIKE